MMERRGSWVTIIYRSEYCIICIRRLQLIFLQNTSCSGGANLLNKYFEGRLYYLPLESDVWAVNYVIGIYTLWLCVQ